MPGLCMVEHSTCLLHLAFLLNAIQPKLRGVGLVGNSVKWFQTTHLLVPKCQGTNQQNEQVHGVGGNASKTPAGKCVDTGWIESVLPSRYSILILKKLTDKRTTRKNVAIVGCECYWRIHILHHEESWDTYNFQHGWYNSCLHEQFVLNISNTIPTHKLSRTEKMLKSCNCTWISHLRSRTRAREPRSSKLMVWSPFTSKLSKSVQALPMAFFRLLKSDISGAELAFEVVLPLLLVSRWIRTISYQWLQWLMIPGRWEECSVCITSSKCVFVQYRLIYLVLDTLQE